MSAPPPNYPPPPGQPFYPPPHMPPGFMGAPGMPPRPYGAMPPPGPWPGSLPPGFSQAPPPPNTSVYVGKISPLVDDDLMRVVLETCGELRSWKRSTDPETGAQKRFGFADFASPDGVLRALRVLREFPLAGSELLLNVSQATQKFLDFHVAQLKSRGRATIVAAPQLSVPPADVAAPEPGSVTAEAAAEAAEEAAADKAAIDAIQDLVLQRLGSVQEIAGKLEAMQQTEPQQRLPPPPPLPPPPALPQRDGGLAATPAADADSFLATLDGSRESDEERAKRLARERERDKERRERERREELRREERAAVERERALERAEAERERERAREVEREREARRARQRDMERDLEEGGFSDSDGARRHALKRRRDAKLREDRRRRRARELEDDEADRRREEQEALLAARKLELAAERAARAPPKEATPPPVLPPPPPPAAQQTTHLDERAPEVENSPAHAAGEAPMATNADDAERMASAPSLALGLGFRKRAPAKKVVALNASIFGEEEALPQKRTLVPIEYTEEELRAALVNEYAAAEGTEAGDGHKKAERDSRKRRDTAERDAKKSLLSLIDSIPTSRAELFAHPVDWAVFDSLRLADTVSRWAAKKVAELLGEAEPSLVEFVTAQTSAHCAPDALLTELQDVLDDEAEAFVVKLWRLIIFETLKNKV